jgi:hypothetical protein
MNAMHQKFHCRILHLSVGHNSAFCSAQHNFHPQTMLRRENRSPIEILGTTQQMLSTLALAAKMDRAEITLYSLCVKFLQYLLELEGWAKNMVA